MRRGYITGGLIVILLIGGGLLFLPSFFARKGVDELAGSLPAGTKFTYLDTHYSLFSRELVLVGGTLHTDDPAMDIDIAEIHIQDGNPRLARAVDDANKNPAANPQATDIAHKVTLRDVHSVYGPLDVRIGNIQIDKPRLFLSELFATLPPLKTAPSMLDTMPNGPEMRTVMQRVARTDLGVSYDRMQFQNVALQANDHVSKQSVSATIGLVDSAGFDRGNVQSSTVNDFTVEANGGSVAVGFYKTGASDQRGFFTALRDGEALESAFNAYPAGDQTIGNIIVKGSDATLATVEEVKLANAVYQDGVPSALNLTVRNAMIYTANMPKVTAAPALLALGYNPAVMGGALSYKLDTSTHQAVISNTSLTLVDGGSLTVDGVFQDIQQGSNAGKVAALGIRYTDASLATRWLNYAAARTGQSVDAVKAGYIAWLQGQRANFAQDPPLGAAIDALTAFVANPHQLTLMMRPPVPVGIADFDKTHPESFSSKLGLQVTAQ